jgi:hypothetical protein
MLEHSETDETVAGLGGGQSVRIGSVVPGAAFDCLIGFTDGWNSWQPLAYRLFSVQLVRYTSRLGRQSVTSRRWIAHLQ